MALVDYGSSDESGEEETETKPVQIPAGKPSSSKDEKTDASPSESTIFSSLPKPRTQTILGGTEDKLHNILLNKPSKSDGSKKDTVKISIPSLSEFENDDASQPAQKKMKQSSKGVGLFSVLPPPKNATVKESNRQLIPNVIKNQISKAKTDNLIKLKSSTTKVGVPHHNGLDEVDDDGDAGSTSFFGEGISTADQQRPAMNYGSENYTSETYCIPDNDVSNIPIPSEDRTVSYPQYNSDMQLNHNPEMDYNNVPSSSDTLELDDKALQILCGGKRKRNQMPVNIIDLSGEEIMPDSKEWLLKQFTEEKKTRSHSHKKNNGPSVQSRRKHQITYLAYQAKAQELELQNQWAQNRMSRRQTQSKYGF